MNRNIALLEKLIKLTSTKELTWERYSKSEMKINPNKKPFFPTSPFENTYPSPTVVLSQSYIAKLNEGFVALFAYSELFFANYVELVLQPSETQLPQAIVSTANENAKISSTLKRLYNLVDFNSDSNVDDYIDSILNHE